MEAKDFFDQLETDLRIEEQKILLAVERVEDATRALKNVEEEKNRIVEKSKFNQVARTLMDNGNKYFSKITGKKFGLGTLAIGIPVTADLVYQAVTGNYRTEAIIAVEAMFSIWLDGLGLASLGFSRNKEENLERWEYIAGKGTLAKENFKRVKNMVERYAEKYKASLYRS